MYSYAYTLTNTRDSRIEREAKNVKFAAVKGREHMDQILHHRMILIICAHKPYCVAVCCRVCCSVLQRV